VNGNQESGNSHILSKPWGDSDRYDFILDNGADRHRIQSLP